MFKALVSATALALLASVATAQDLYPGDDEFTAQGTVEGWNLYADQDRKACLIERVDAAGNVTQMGLTSDKNMGYIGVFTQQDVGLSGATDAEITVLVNGHAYTGKSHVRKHGLAEGYQGGYLLTNNPDFVNDLRNGMELVAFPNAEGIGVVIGLDGTKAAIDAAVECTTNMSS